MSFVSPCGNGFLLSATSLFAERNAMSAFGGKADMTFCGAHVAF
jgi:hypothetical protein